jgi:hypothetical protein
MISFKDENLRMIPGIGFNIFYLAFIWTLVVKMYRTTGYRTDKDHGGGSLLRLGILMLIHARQKGDRFFTYISILIFFSYAFYLPVIMFIQKVPLFGMLMIPKTVAYLLMAVAVYRKFFKKPEYE